MVHLHQPRNHHLRVDGPHAAVIEAPAEITAVGMAGPAEVFGFEYHALSVVFGLKTEMCGGGTEQQSCPDAAGACKVRQAGIDTERQIAVPENASAFVKRKFAGEGDAPLSDVILQPAGMVPVVFPSHDDDIPPLDTEKMANGDEISVMPLLVFPRAERKKGHHRPSDVAQLCALRKGIEPVAVELHAEIEGTCRQPFAAGTDIPQCYRLPHPVTVDPEIEQQAAFEMKFIEPAHRRTGYFRGLGPAVRVVLKVHNEVPLSFGNVPVAAERMFFDARYKGQSVIVTEKVTVIFGG